MRSPLRSYRPAPISPSTSLSISNCSTASATARRKSPSPAFSSSSASTNLSSVIASSRRFQVEVLQLHLSRRIDDHLNHTAALHRGVHPKIPPPARTLTVDDVRVRRQLPKTLSRAHVQHRTEPGGIADTAAVTMQVVQRTAVFGMLMQEERSRIDGGEDTANVLAFAPFRPR